MRLFHSANRGVASFIMPRGQRVKRPDKHSARGSKSSRKKQERKALDRNALSTFAKSLSLEGMELKEVARDGNCFFRSISDQLDGDEDGHEKFRQKVMDYVESHEDDFSPFMSFGESEEEEDKDFEAYVARMRTDAEWAGQVELIAAAQALTISIVVHQHEHPTYRIECQTDAKKPSKKAPREVHVSYHDGEHYNSVHPIGGSKRNASASGSAQQSGEDDTPEVDAADDDAADDAEEDAGVDDVASRVEEMAVKEEEEPDAAEAPSGAGGVKMTPKAKRKEEKKLRKEQKYRQAVLEAGGAMPSLRGGATKEESSEQSRDVITL